MASKPKGLPGLRGPEHIGITVPDLDEAVHFFTEVVGGVLVFDGGRLENAPDYMTARLNVNPAASMRYCFVRCGNGTNFEIFQYSSPDQNRTVPRNSDIGGHHIAFYVDDMDAAVAHLKQSGVKVLGEPEYIASGPAAGSAWVYFMAPWGLQLELVSYPNGKAYEKGAEHVLWNPKFPTR